MENNYLKVVFIYFLNAVMHLTEQEGYFHKAEMLVGHAAEILQEIFKSRWREKTGKVWNQGHSTAFISGPGKDIYLHSMHIQREMLEKGIVKMWDVSLLSQILRSFQSDRDSYEKRQRHNAGIHELTEIRNILAHNDHKILSLEEYEKLRRKYKEATSKLREYDKPKTKPDHLSIALSHEDIRDSTREPHLSHPKRKTNRHMIKRMKQDDCCDCGPFLAIVVLILIFYSLTK